MSFIKTYAIYKLIGMEAGRLQEALLCAKAKRQQQQMFSVAKAKRQLQSAQSERKSTSCYGEEPLQKSMNLFICDFQILMQKYIINSSITSPIHILD